MRMFVALDLPDGLKAEIADLSRTLSRDCGGRFVDYEGYHLTLAFLGVIDEMGVALAADALDEACIGMAPVRLVPNGLGKFGSSQRSGWGLPPSQSWWGFSGACATACASEGSLSTRSPSVRTSPLHDTPVCPKEPCRSPLFRPRRMPHASRSSEARSAPTVPSTHPFIRLGGSDPSVQCHPPACSCGIGRC